MNRAPSLRAYYVWLPVLPGDTKAAADRTAAAMSDSRARHYWDPGLRFAREMAAQLCIGDATAPDGTRAEGVAWDVYLLYGRGRQDVWRPGLWMHQLNVATGQKLDVDTLRAEMATLLEP